MSTTLTHFKIGRKNFHLIAFKDYTDGALWLYTIVCYKIIFEWKPVWKGFWQSWQNVSFYLHFWVCKVITLVCLLVWTNYQNNFTKLSFNCHNVMVRSLQMITSFLLSLQWKIECFWMANLCQVLQIQQLRRGNILFFDCGQN